MPIKKHLVFCILFFFTNSIWGTIPVKPRPVKTWKISDPFAVVDTIPVDTLHLNFQDANPIDRFSIANSYNGNLGSPIEPKLYFDRPEKSDFIFSEAFYPYIMDIEKATFYNVKMPYTHIVYNTGGSTYRQQDHIKFLFTANANKSLNFGTNLDYFYAVGEYNNQAAKRFSGSLFGSYNGKHYSATGLVTVNNMFNHENGGIADSSYIYEPLGIATKDIPTRINGYSVYRKNVFFYNQQYTIGFERPVHISPDSVKMEYVPVTRFAHTIKYEDPRKRYYEPTVEKDFYQNTFLPFTQTNDTAALQSLTNTVSVNMAEEFNKWLKFGMTAFLQNEVQRYTFKIDSVLERKNMSSTKVGGILSKYKGPRFRYEILGEMGLLGYKTGDFQIKGKLGGYFKLFKDSIILTAGGFVKSNKPSYFLQHYHSNHFCWDNNFNKTYRTNINGTFSIPTRYFSLNVSVENLTDYIYFNSQALPVQHNGNVQVLALNLKKDFHFGKFNLENNVVYQRSSNSEVIPLPAFVLYHNLYYNGLWFNVLSAQLGANLRYFTEYYSPCYMPATAQFYNQSTTKVGNFPVINVYANFHLKQARFFVEYYHVNQLFMKTAYFSMPNYPLSPAIFKIGVSANFYN